MHGFGVSSQRLLQNSIPVCGIAGPSRVSYQNGPLEPNGNPAAKTYQEAMYSAQLPAIVFGVENIQKEYERLKDLGVMFKSEPITTEWGTQALFDDTCGNYIQLHQN